MVDLRFDGLYLVVATLLLFGFIATFQPLYRFPHTVVQLNG
jgi:hypothetical protein